MLPSGMSRTVPALITARRRPSRRIDDSSATQRQTTRAAAGFLHRMSAEALYYRFMSVPRIDHDKAMQMVRVDLDHQRVLVAECAGTIVATAGYYMSKGAADRAEVAFAVADAWRGRGIGTRLLECLAEIGRLAGVCVFDAYVLGENRRMMDVFRESGFAVTRELDHGVIHVSLQLETSPRFIERAAGRSQQAAAASMRPFFEPNVVAVIGANRTRGRIGSEILHNLITSGFSGKLVPVHPEADVVEGLAARRRVCDIEGSVDLAVIAVPAAKVAAAVDDCIAKGVKGIVVITAGFGETGGAGAALEAELVEKIRAAGIRMDRSELHGHHQHGSRGVSERDLPAGVSAGGRVAFSTQSGALGLAILEYVSRGIRHVHLRIHGNKADVSSTTDPVLGEDPRTDVIFSIWRASETRGSLGRSRGAWGGRNQLWQSRPADRCGRARRVVAPVRVRRVTP